MNDELRGIYQICEERKRQCHRVCQEAADLMKPWPRRHSSKPEAAPKDVRTATPSTAVNLEDSQCNVPDPELVAVDDLIAKAERIRLKQAKKRDTEDNADYNSSETTDCQPQTCKTSRSTSNGSSTSTVGSGQSTKTKTVGVPKHSDQVATTGYISQTTLDKVLTKSAPSQRPKKSSVPAFRVSSAKYKPAHAKAPFKTESVPARKSARPYSTANKQSKAGSNEKGPSSYGTKVSSKISRINVGARVLSKQDPYSVNHSTSKKTDRGLELESSPPHNPSLPGNDYNTLPVAQNMKVLQDSGQGVIRHNNPPPASISVPEMPSNRTRCPRETDAKVNEDASDQHALFDLLQDGKKLQVPGKFLKLMSTNKKLREKSLMPTNTNVLTTPSPHNVFLDKLEKHIADAIPEDHFKYICPVRKLLMCYIHLMAILKKQSTTIVSDSLGWYEVLTLKRSLEFVMSNIEDLEETFSTLSMNFPPGSSSITKAEGIQYILRKETINQPHIWFPNGSLCGQRLWGMLEIQGPMKYRELPEVVRWLQLSWRLQQLSVQDMMLFQINKSLLPLLQQPSADVALYRCLYSLTCSGGRSFPAVVSSRMADSNRDSEEEF